MLRFHLTCARTAVQDDEPKEAIRLLKEVATSEKEKGEWGFKAWKRIFKLQFRLNQTDDVRWFIPFPRPISWRPPNDDRPWRAIEPC